MSNTLANPGPYDPLDRTAPDEPVFTLVGRDPRAGATVRHWIDLTRKWVMAQILDLAPHEPRPEWAAAELRKCAEAEIIAVDMDRYRKAEPDRAVGVPTRATYSGIAPDAAKLDETARRELIHAQVRGLREAAFFISEFRDQLSAIGEIAPGETVDLETALNLINNIADAHTPKRPGVQPSLPLQEAAPAGA